MNILCRIDKVQDIGILLAWARTVQTGERLNALHTAQFLIYNHSVQQRLIKFGYLDGVADGKYGEATRDAVRWFLIARKPDSQLTFDIDLARSQSMDNPVYYVQVSHARMHGLVRQLNERGLSYDQAHGLAQPLDLDDVAAHELIVTILRYPDVVAAAGRDLEPHQVAAYLLELAQAFQTYYNDHQFLVDDDAQRHARLVLAMATRQVLANGLELLGIHAPEVM